MVTIRFVPVNIKRRNCTVYSNDTSYPLELLERAVDFLRDGKQSGVYYGDSGDIRFSDNDTIAWSLANVYLAYNAYCVARDAGISFYIVMGEEKLPELFVSSQIHNGRIVVNAHDMSSLYITHPVHRSKLSALVDKSVSSQHCYNLFTTLRDIERGKKHYLHSLIINRGLVNEEMKLSPILTPGELSDIAWTPETVQALRNVYNHVEAENDYFVAKDTHFITNYLDKPIHIVSGMVEYVLNTYDQLAHKKSNYFALRDLDGKARIYLSTNFRYAVQASSFRVVTISNQQTRNLLKLYAKKEQVSYSDLNLAWEFACMGAMNGE